MNQIRKTLIYGSTKGTILTGKKKTEKKPKKEKEDDFLWGWGGSFQPGLLSGFDTELK